MKRLACMMLGLAISLGMVAGAWAETNSNVQPKVEQAKGESEGFESYLDETNAEEKDDGLVLYEDPDGAKLQLGGKDNDGAAMKLPY